MDYDALAHLLRHEDSDLDAAELHGMVTAAMCVDPASDAWLTLVSKGAPSTELAAAIDTLLSETKQAEQGFEFSPLLPSDEAPLDERVEALASWCRGFVDGLIASGVHDPAALPGEAGEFLRDLQSIGEAEPPPTPTEEDEHAYAELVEYLRAGVGHVYEECRRKPAAH